MKRHTETKSEMLAKIYTDISAYMGAETHPGSTVQRFSKATVEEIFNVWKLWQNDSQLSRATVVMEWINVKAEYC